MKLTITELRALIRESFISIINEGLPYPDKGAPDINIPDPDPDVGDAEDLPGEGDVNRLIATVYP
tara:strand:- start:3002 stop:3196 length:195 start_codon:yes stop_codon:yes gene_type:complete